MCTPTGPSHDSYLIGNNTISSTNDISHLDIMDNDDDNDINSSISDGENPDILLTDLRLKTTHPH